MENFHSLILFQCDKKRNVSLLSHVMRHRLFISRKQTLASIYILLSHKIKKNRQQRRKKKEISAHIIRFDARWRCDKQFSDSIGVYSMNMYSNNVCIISICSLLPVTSMRCQSFHALCNQGNRLHVILLGGTYAVRYICEVWHVHDLSVYSRTSPCSFSMCAINVAVLLLLFFSISLEYFRILVPNS